MFSTQLRRQQTGLGEVQTGGHNIGAHLGIILMSGDKRPPVSRQAMGSAMRGAI